MAITKHLKILAALVILLPSMAIAQVTKKTSCSIPLDERKSAPSVDLLDTDETPMDRDALIDFINAGGDTSSLQPQLSDFYINKKQSAVEYYSEFPSEEDAVQKPLTFLSYDPVDHATLTYLSDDDGNRYTMTVSYDINSALARAALLRKLGYFVPSPKYYKKLAITFEDQETREEFLTRIARGRNLGSWVAGGMEEVNKKNLTVTLINVALESAIVGHIPPMHWGFFESKVLNGRRPFRALIVPLTLLDIDESVNMYSFEPAKIENDNLVFSRVYANTFKKETTLGDARWIARKIAQLNKQDWIEIIRAGHYPADLEALILQKTFGRIEQLMALLKIQPKSEENDPTKQPKVKPDTLMNPVFVEGYERIPYTLYLTSGSVINGKVYQQHYDGYPQTFAYGDPLNPLRLSEVIRYFSVELISNGIKFALDQANKYLQVIGPDKYIKKHTEDFYNDILDHVTNHPGEPYVQKVNAWGGPIAGGGVSANRSVVAGTYYGSSSPVQMVDSISVNARVGAFVGVSGLKSVGLSFTPTLTYTRSYVHVRPIDDIKTALKDNWAHLAVPFSMAKISNVLLSKEGEDASTTIDNFLSEMKTGEMFMVIDGFTLGNNTMLGIPIGAMLGFAAPFANISENINVNNQYAITGRTTFYKSEKGLQVYLTDMKQQAHEVSADTSFFLKLFSAAGSKMLGKAETEAFIFPSEFEKDEDKVAFQSGIRRLLRTNQADGITGHFKPYHLDHESDGKRFKVKVGPWQWTKRETMNLLSVVPNEDPEGRYNRDEFKRTVLQGQINRISGWDFYGFFGSILNYFKSFINIGGGAKGDDPSSNFMGTSKALIVSTELETTENYPNNTLVRLQQTYAGWTMKKKKLLKLLDAIGKRLDGFNPNGGLIDEDSFSQTKRVQAYNVIWNLSIYQPGVEKLFDVLNTELYNTRSAVNYMARLMGFDEYRQYCQEVGRSVGFVEGPLTLEMVENREHRAYDTSFGKTTMVNCATPWMQSIFDLRDQLRKHREVFDKDIHNEADAQAKIHWTNKTLMKLESEIDLPLLIKWAGTDNTYFQVSVAGYRKGDERAQDEEGRSTYFSNTVGSTNTNIRNGPIDDIGRESQIMQHELSARYLSDGF